MMKIALFLVFAFIATAYGSRILMNGNLHGSYVVPEDGVNNQINLGFSGEVALRVELNKRQLYWYFHHTAADGLAGTFNGVSFWQGKPGVRGEQLWDASEALEISGNGASPHLGWHEFEEVDDDDEDGEDEEDVFEDIVEALLDGELYIQLTTTHYTDGLLRAQFDQNYPMYTQEVPEHLLKNVKLHALTKHSVKAKAKLHGDFVLPHGVTTGAGGSVSVKYADKTNTISISYSTSTDHKEQVWSDVLFLTGNDDTQDTSVSHVLWDFSLLPEEDSNDENPLQKRKITFPATQYALRQIFERSNTYLLVEDNSVPHIRGNLENSHASTVVFSMAIIVLVALINILF